MLVAQNSPSVSNMSTNETSFPSILRASAFTFPEARHVTYNTEISARILDAFVKISTFVRKIWAQSLFALQYEHRLPLCYRWIIVMNEAMVSTHIFATWRGVAEYEPQSYSFEARDCVAIWALIKRFNREHTMFAAMGIDERRNTSVGSKSRLPFIAYARSDEATVCVF